ncbi:glycosyltransferase [Pusillimonas sp. TS35]|nr:glycosyltransferase [Pusillimonas sp. TS35]
MPVTREPAARAQPVRITHVIVGLDIGGAERFLFRLIQAHQGNPDYVHRVISLTSRGVLGPRLEAMGVPVTHLAMRGIADTPRTYLRLVRALRCDRPDVLQCWMYYADLLGGLAGRQLGIRPVLWGIRNSHLESGGTRLKRGIRKLCAMCSSSLPTRIVCVAHSAQSVHAAAGYDRRRMMVIHNGYDPDQFQPNASDRRRLRGEWGIANNAVLVGSVGRYSPAKDQASFIRAATLAGRRNERLRFVLIGRDLTSDNQEIMTLIQASGFPERFLTLGERADVPACMSALDVFCLHSRTEGFPNVLGEAMSVGLPCVTTDVGDARVLVGDTGKVVAPGDTEALAQAIDALAAHDLEQLQALGQAARRRIEHNFTLAHAVGKFEALYMERA